MRIHHILAAVMVAFLWGGNFVASKIGVAYLPPFFYTGMRFLIVAVLMVWLVPRPNVAQLKQILAIAFVLDTLHVSFLVMALHQGLDIASVAIIAQLGVPFSCVLGVALFGDKLGIWRVMGLLISFLGMSIVTGTPSIIGHPLAFCIALAAALAWAISNIMVKNLKNVAALQLTTWLAIFAVPQMFLLSALFEGNGWALLPSMPANIFYAMLYTALASTIAGYGLWSMLLARYDVSQVAPFSLLTPIFGIAIGQWFVSEELTWQILGGGVLTLLGVGIIVIRRPKLMEIGERV